MEAPENQSPSPPSDSEAPQTPPPPSSPPPQYPPEPPYPLTFSVDYPDRPLNRPTSFFRWLWIIPIGIIASLIGSGTISVEGAESYSWSWAIGGFLFFPLLLMILFRKAVPARMNPFR